MTEKEKEKKAREIEAKVVAICEFLGDTSLFDVAMIFGAVFEGIICSTKIDPALAKAFAALVQERIIQAIEFEYNTEEEKPCSTK